MSEEAMVRNCAPTLAGIKTGNLFSYRYESIAQMRASVRFWNCRLHDRGVRILPLRYRNQQALIYCTVRQSSRTISAARRQGRFCGSAAMRPRTRENALHG